LLDAAGADVMVERGRMLERSSGLDLALEAYGRALRLDPRSAEAQEGLVRVAAVSDARDPVLALLRHLVTSGSDPLGARVSLARLYRADGRTEEAGAELLAVLREDPSNVRALKLVAAIQGDLGEPGAVEVFAGRAFTMAPRDGEAAALLASGSLIAGDPAAALERATTALRLEPGLELALRVRALALARLSRPEEARAAFQELVAPAAASWRSFLYQGAFLADVSDWTAARRAFETAVDLAPDSVEAWRALQKAAEAQGDESRAAQAAAAVQRLTGPSERP
jgi:tetratricopeptide (TPR) repeat protein